MKILHIINNLGSGGAERLLEESLPIMKKNQNIEIEVLLLTDEKNVFDKKLYSEGIKISVVPLRKIYDFRNIFFIRKFIISEKFDIVHAHLFPTQYWVSLASKLIWNNKPKFITTEHSTNNKRREKSYFKIIEKLIYLSYDSIVSISEQANCNLKQWLGINKAKFITIENGINIDKFKNAKPYEKEKINNIFSDKTKLICMVGRFTEAKNQRTLIKAIKDLPNDIHLLLVGEGYLKENNMKLAHDLKVSNRVHFLGFRNDVERILKTCDIIVLSSNWEGLSLSSVEGMASGKPFIASRVNGLEEVVGSHGILFENNNDKELRNIILELFSNKKYYNEISLRCMKRAEDYNIDNMVKKEIELYLTKKYRY